MAILDVGRDSYFSVGATARPGRLYVSPDAPKGGHAGQNGHLLDRIEAALAEADGDPARASAICGVAEREIARIKGLMAWAESPEADAEVRESRKEAARSRRAVASRPVTAADVAQLVSAAETFGSYPRAARALGWTESRMWRVHGYGLRRGLIARKRGAR